MSQKKANKQPEIRWCENDGGLGIEACEGVSELAVVELAVDPAFTGLDRETFHLCDDCAIRFMEHAEEMGYDVEEV